MEKDDEVKGQGNSYSAENWIFDPRLGRRGNVDKKGKIWESSYATLGNNPIGNIDPKGDDWYTSNGNDLIWFQDKAEIHVSTSNDIYVRVTDRWSEYIPGIGVMEHFDSGLWFPEYNLNGEYLGGKDAPQTQAEIDYIGSQKSVDNLGKFFAYGLAAFTGAGAIAEIGVVATATFVVEEGVEYAIESATGIPVIMNPLDVAQYSYKKYLKSQVQKELVEKYGKETTQSFGSYTIKYADNTSYHGAGNLEEAISGAARKSNKGKDMVTNFDWKPSNSKVGQFQDEAKRLNMDGGAKSSTNRNIRDSPGNRKYKDAER